MRVEKNKVYHVPTMELKKDFLQKCEKEGFRWNSGSSPLGLLHDPMYGAETTIRTVDGLLSFGNVDFEKKNSFVVTLWEIEKPQPKFKVGDIVRGIDKNRYSVTNTKMTKAKVTKVAGEKIVIQVLEHESKFAIDDTPYHVDPKYFELIEEPKSKPTIIKLPNNHKIVINKPYTIYTDGKVTGKAKCNPEDEWNTEEGIRLAVERYKHNNQLNPFRHIHTMPKHTMWVPSCGDFYPPETYSKTLAKKMDEEIKKTIQERFPIGSKVEMVKASGKPRTTFPLRTIARVEGHFYSRSYGNLVICKNDMNYQYINPDDLRLING